MQTGSSIFLLIFLFFAGCKPNPMEKLAKKWKPVDVTGEGISDKMKEDILKAGNMMEFTKDGKFISSSDGEKTDTGTFSLSENGKILKVNSGMDDETVMDIKELKINRTIIDNHGLVLVLEPVE